MKTMQARAMRSRLLAVLALAAIVAVVAGDGSSAAEEQRTGGDEMLRVGEPAPDFEARDEQGRTVRLADFRDRKNVVLIFYPADETPGCTAQLCEVRDHYAAFERADVQVYGVNPADATSHHRFAARHELPFPLLVDEDKRLARAYGCLGLLFVQRTVYGIDQRGTIVFAQRGKPSPETVLATFASAPGDEE